MEDKKQADKKNLLQNTLVIILLTIVLWAFAFPLIKIGLEELSPINLTIIRLFIACVLFLVIRLYKSKSFSKLQKKDIPSIFILGFLGIVIYHLGLNYGEQYISASLASLIIATIPIFVVIFAVAFLKEKITKPIILGVFIALIGVFIISIFGKPTISLEFSYNSGLTAVLIASLVGAGYTVAGKKMLSRYNPLSLTSYAFLIGSIGLIPFLSISLIEEIMALSLKGWFVVIFLGIFPTVIAYILWYTALEIKSASKLGVYLYFIPILSTIISLILLNEEITLYFLFGGLLVILGLHIVNRNQIKNEKTK